MPDSTDTSTTTTTDDQTASGTADDGRGGKQAVLADLASERDRRQALEQQVAQLRDSQTRQNEALAKAFGLKPEETSDVATLTATVAALQEQFTSSQRQNLVLSVANEFGITDKDTIADLSAIGDETAMRNLAGRLKAATETSSGRPKPDLTQGGSDQQVSQTPESEFADFLKRQLTSG